jgi:hypothetical protein
MTEKKERVNRPVNGLVRPPSSYEEYLLLSEKDKLRLMKQNQAKRPNSVISVKNEAYQRSAAT